MANGKSTFSVLSLVISAATLILILYFIFTIPGGNRVDDYKIEKNLAGELTDNNLYKAAIEEYNKIAADRDLDSRMRANINYLMAKLYFENLNDYENAAAHYVMARSLDPQGSFFDEAGKNLIFCLERMGRLVDAKRELDKTVNIDSIYTANKGGTMVAKIGGVPVFLSEIEKEIQSLPPEMQKQYLGKQGKQAFLNQYIGLELMYRAAIREGLQSNPDIIKKEKEIERQLLIEKYATEKVMPTADIDSTDVRNFYIANKKERYGDKSFDEIKTQVLFDYQQGKAQKAFSDYVSKLAAVEKVQIFEENIKY